MKWRKNYKAFMINKCKTEKLRGKMIDDSAPVTFLMLMSLSTNLYVSCQTPSFNLLSIFLTVGSHGSNFSFIRKKLEKLLLTITKCLHDLPIFNILKIKTCLQLSKPWRQYFNTQLLTYHGYVHIFAN